MTSQPYASARRVFWVVDNGSSHRGQASARGSHDRWPTCGLIHLPVHASWLNQVEIYFSIVQRKVAHTQRLPDLTEVETRLLDFQQHYEQIATPFEWKFTQHRPERTYSPASPPTSNAASPPPPKRRRRIRHRNSVPDH